MKRRQQAGKKEAVLVKLENCIPHCSVDSAHCRTILLACVTSFVVKKKRLYHTLKLFIREYARNTKNLASFTAYLENQTDDGSGKCSLSSLDTLLLFVYQISIRSC